MPVHKYRAEAHGWQLTVYAASMHTAFARAASSFAAHHKDVPQFRRDSERAVITIYRLPDEPPAKPTEE